MNAQGEDVVAGTRTPLPIRELERANPTVYRQLLAIRKTLERHYRDMQDIEFTIEQAVALHAADAASASAPARPRSASPSTW